YPAPWGASYWGCGGFVPPHTQSLQEEIFDTAGLALRLLIFSVTSSTVLPYINPYFCQSRHFYPDCSPEMQVPLASPL
ncbi:MAG: hypothetical protein LBB61_06095, partial [Treponema sp.]|nr:hypothetical protein [Treponema sp.]